jgi:hypothetical protein
MDHKILFKEWLGKSPEVMYGFRPNTTYLKTPFYELEPIEPFSVEKCLNALAATGEIDGKKADDKWKTQLSYGYGLGKISVTSSPYGSYKFVIRRYVTDAKGNLVPICRLVIPLTNDYNHRGPNDPGEEVLAVKMYDKIKQISSEPYPAPNCNWQAKFAHFVYNFSKAVKLKHPLIMVYQGTVKLDDNNYLISFTFKGYGNGVPNSQKAEEFLINWQYLPDAGLLRCWGYDVVSPVKQREWQPAVSEWDEYFCPTQPEHQITSCIMEAFMTY